MSNQPKWAWWVVGIVIPVIGIVVSVQLATKSDSGNKSDSDGNSQSANTAAPAPGRSGSDAKPSMSAAANEPAKVLYGPTKVTLNANTYAVDLDGNPPVLLAATKGSDLWVGFNLPFLTLSAPTSTDTIATLATDGPEPTKAECTQRITKNGTYSSPELALGTRLCVATDDGHIAYLRLTSVPSLKTVVFEATVWE